MSSTKDKSFCFDEWFQETFYRDHSCVDLSLSRMVEVKRRLPKINAHVILVGGTNGKGSTCAYLEAIYCRAGYRVGSFVSPHLITVRERIKYNGSMLPEEVWIDLSSFLLSNFSDLNLTYFESITALSFIFWQKYHADVLIYEVGLGGALDATNVLDPECSIVSSVDLDHQNYLGHDRESIGREKAGIFRKGKLAVCGDLSPPSSLLEYALKEGSNICCLQKDFFVSWEPVDSKQWRYSSPIGVWKALPVPSMRGRHQLRNASCALRVVQELFNRFPVSVSDIRAAFIGTTIPGRFQVIPGRPSVVLDVAHNPSGVNCLRDTLIDMPYSPNTIAIFSCLRDKDYYSMLKIIKDQFCQWFVCELTSSRSCSLVDIVSSLQDVGVDTSTVHTTSDPFDSYNKAYRSASLDDRIVIFGSFYLVGSFLQRSNFLWHGSCLL
ncbi:MULTISPECIES: bifunctional folylpolyglutamate synthase/dihydrofolate synthase [Candidatus Ichthyocystis]|uniref:Dihydrofolate synthase/folylpolyglutamate synthase n=1 Tax=Candidatus Ichthyocystis hellenicum TaxID=1561003 RepID=A0A0S4M1Z8_9BURK|nr:MULTISPECIES: folylpolyglutamate synthase/dihydrofolate synthase family protein [Ichthyocystis]CUT17785.1 putative folylpolyglutamate synthase [Candidatus Ichthyocystis hellenicum]